MVAHLVSTGLQEYYFRLSESCHGDGLDAMRGVQASPVGEKQEEKYNAVSTAGLFMGGGGERKDKTTRKLSSGRIP